MTALVDERALDARLAQLEAARSWSPRVVSRLEALIREGEDGALFRVNPFTFARERDIAVEEAIDLFLHASAVGMFVMDWLLICPMCACAVESFARLRAVLRQFRCPMCHNDFEAAMDDFIAVYFNVAPQIRKTRYQRPETLDALDYVFVFKGVREGLTPKGTPFGEAMAAQTRAVGFLEPGQSSAFAFEVEAGTVIGVSSDDMAGFVLKAEGEAATAPQPVRLDYGETGYQPAEARIAPGPVALEIVNTTARRGVLAVIQSQGCGGAPGAFLSFAPYLTGKHLLTSQTFRSLFRSEVVGGAQGLAIRNIALLFTDIKGSTALYQRIGDLNAFQLVQQHFDWLREATVRHGGAVVKTIGDAVMAAYPDAAHAVAAALAMREAVERFNRGQPERPVSLKIGVHHGAAIAVTLNDELDYFGQTVNIASRVQAMAGAQEIWITDEVWHFPGVQGLLEAYALKTRIAELQGIDRPMAVRQIGPRAHA
ncbi:MAG: DUF5939 domain-containing protein [Geminicoccaceae bacterium]